ncbi:MAG: DUF695 domain-containing protein [Xanthomonadales bacterium]|nr:DUF695 domain-containing protein [Xanthomonadales bacterium]
MGCCGRVIGGKPHLFRVRTRTPCDLLRFTVLEMIAISWEYETDASAMPGAEDPGRMKVLEDRLENCLETEGVSLLTVVVTGDGVREWQWYTRSVEDMMRIANEGLQGEQPFPVSFFTDTIPNGARSSGSRRRKPNYVFKPTAEEVARIIQTPSRGGGLTRR